MQKEFNLKIIILFLGLFILACFSCKSQEKQANNKLKLKKVYYDEGKTVIKEQYYLNPSRLRDSLYVLFDTNGDTIRKGYYKDSRKHGLWEEPEFKNLAEQGSRAYYYYHHDALKKKVEKVWEEKNLKTRFSETTMMYYQDSVSKIHKTWADKGEFIKGYSKRIYFDPSDLTQTKSSSYSKQWYYNSNIVMFEYFRVRLNHKWEKHYTPQGKLHKSFEYTDEGKVKKLTFYDENEKVKKVYHVSKQEHVFDKVKKQGYTYYYDENGKRLDNELFDLDFSQMILVEGE